MDYNIYRGHVLNECSCRKSQRMRVCNIDWLIFDVCPKCGEVWSSSPSMGTRRMYRTTPKSMVIKIRKHFKMGPENAMWEEIFMKIKKAIK